MSSRDLIMRKLRQGKRPFPDSSPPRLYEHMVPLADTSLAALTARFVQEAEKLACKVYQVDDDAAALATILRIVGTDTAVSAWELSQVPLKGLSTVLRETNIAVANPDNLIFAWGLRGQTRRWWRRGA